MDHFIPLRKQTKKQQKAHHRERRNTWGSVRPVTRVMRSRKQYDRAREKNACRDQRLEA